MRIAACHYLTQRHLPNSLAVGDAMKPGWSGVFRPSIRAALLNCCSFAKLSVEVADNEERYCSLRSLEGYHLQFVIQNLLFILRKPRFKEIKIQFNP